LLLIVITYNGHILFGAAIQDKVKKEASLGIGETLRICNISNSLHTWIFEL